VWSRWAWVTTTAVSSEARYGSSARFRCSNSSPPWYMPQSIRTLWSPKSMRVELPVTTPHAPWKVTVAIPFALPGAPLSRERRA
jgi:hypothetical protein